MSTDLLPDTRVWLTRSECADYIGVSERTIQNYIARGVLPAHRVRETRTVRIRRDDLEHLLCPVELVVA